MVRSVESRTCPADEGGCGLIKTVKDFPLSWGRPTKLCRVCITNKIRANSSPKLRQVPPTLQEVWEQAATIFARVIEENKEKPAKSETQPTIAGIPFDKADVDELARRKAKLRRRNNAVAQS